MESDGILTAESLPPDAANFPQHLPDPSLITYRPDAVSDGGWTLAS